MERPTEQAVLEVGDYEEKLKRFFSLMTPTEKRIVSLCVLGMEVKEIASLLEVNRRSVQYSLKGVKEKAIRIYGEELVEGRNPSMRSPAV